MHRTTVTIAARRPRHPLREQGRVDAVLLRRLAWVVAAGVLIGLLAGP